VPGSLVGDLIVVVEGTTMDIYRSDRGRLTLQDWCRAELRRRMPSIECRVVGSPLGPTHLATAGSGGPRVVLLPGTNFGVATSIPLVGALATRCRVTVVDVPGQPGLSSGDRPDGDLVGRFGGWLDGILAEIGDGPVVVVGESRGAALALCATPGPSVGGLVLAAPAGLVTARVTPRVVGASLPWLLRPTPARASRLLSVLTGGARVDDHDRLVEWLTLVARHARSSLAPLPLPTPVLAGWRATPTRVVLGERDVFFPARKVVAPARRLLHADVGVVTGRGHALSHLAPDAIARAVRQVQGLRGIGRTES
jgi:pimeloyl-ACP methyl ester carboxylesterase